MKERDPRLPLTCHIRELRKRIVISALSVLTLSIASAPLAPRIFSLIAEPITRLLPPGSQLIALGPFEAWLIYFKISLASGVVAASPIWISQILAFASPAMTPLSKRRIITAGTISGICFIAGVAFCYTIILPQALYWSVRLTEAGGIKLMPQMSTYTTLVLELIVAFGLAFETPILTAILIRLNIVTHKKVAHARPYVIVAAFLLAALLPPPDVITQIALALPLIILFEFGLLLGRITSGRKRGACPNQSHLV